MTRALALFALVIWISDAAAVPRLDAGQGAWQDYFSDLSGLSYNKQGAQSSPGGFTVSSDPVFWSQPFNEAGLFESFSNPASAGMRADPTVLIEYLGTSMERVTLWARTYIPIAAVTDFKETNSCTIMANCTDALLTSVCALDGMARKTQNGTLRNDWIMNMPYVEPQRTTGAAWGHIDYSASYPQISIDAFYTLPILYGISETSLFAGSRYNVAFVSSASLNYQGDSHLGDPVDYMELRLVERSNDVVHASALVQEKDYLYSGFDSDFERMTPFTLDINPLPSVAGAVWDFRIVSKVQPNTTHNHPTIVGPVVVTGAEGQYESPSLDTLSDQTVWMDLSWSCDQATPYVDSNMLLPLGKPIAPLQIAYQVSDPSATPVSIPPAAPSADGKIDMTLVSSSATPIHDGSGGQVTGRYFKYRLNLYSRSAASDLDADLAAIPLSYWGGFRPFVRRISVKYQPAASQAVSVGICPPSVKKWGVVRYSVFKPEKSEVHVDVLSESGTVLLSDIASGVSIEAIDPYVHSRIKLRATLECDPGNTSFRPVLESWEATWEPLPEIVEVKCNSIRPERGETCSVQIGVPERGRVKAVVYDVAGQGVRTLADGEMSPQALIVTWDGRNESGRIVASGVYFLNVSVPGAKKVKRLAVVR